MNLTKRVALVTGAKRIGAVVATELARAGADVAVCYGRSQAEALEVVAQIKALGRRGNAFQADLSVAAACDALVARTAEEFGRLDILVNMASVYRERSFDQLTAAEWDAVVNVDLRAAFLCARAAVPWLRKQGGGRIINFSDWIARSGRPRYKGYLPYYVAKAGVIGLTEALALELAAENILVNAVAPGPILAPPETSEEQYKAVEDATPLGRWGGEIEIAKIVLMMLDNDFMTGETIRVDGGRHVK
jgi:NAD(P)-dependent dehydrogenase (short-subunit alcohol dehydrogenase family)